MKKLIFSLIFIFFSFFLYAQQALNYVTATWTKVLPGKVIAEPQRTSKGFAVMTDARNIMAYSNEGKFLWESNLPYSSNSTYHILPDDFCVTVTNSSKKLTLLNPDGNALWYIYNDFPITKKPLKGRDGRIFIAGDNYVKCLGIKGITKWTVETPLQNGLELQELSDGSIVVFLRELKEGKTKALRISPFGETVEDITFAGEVLTALTCEEGILVTFSDGTCGLFALEDNKSQHKWLLKKQNMKASAKDYFILSSNNKDVAYINHQKTQLEIDFINLSDGTLNGKAVITDFTDEKNIYYTQAGILAADSQKAYFYNNFGRFIWSGDLPQKDSRESFNYTFFTDTNNFIIFGTNWTANAFRTSQYTEQKAVKKDESPKPKYKAYFTIDPSQYDIIPTPKIDSAVIGDERFSEINDGFYGKKEILWTSQLLSACQAYKNIKATSNYGARLEKNAFETDFPGLERLFNQIPLYQTDNFTDYEYFFLKTERNPTLLLTLLRSICENPYDPEGKLLEGLQVIASSITIKDDKIYSAVCDAVYEICVFMGSQAFYNQGKDILEDFLYPKYSSTTRTYARNTLKKLLGKKGNL